MKAQELRIGNWVHHNDIISASENEGNFKWDICHFYDLERHHLNTESIEPIPLTEDWLLKFGFQNKGLFTNKIALSGHPSGDMDGSIIFRIGEYGQDIYLFENEFYFELASHTDDYGEEITTKKIQFLHQLQNLYFALTGEELKLSE